MFIDKWEKENKENLDGLKFIDDGERKLFYRFSEAKQNPKSAPLLVILHGHGVKKPTNFKHESWNVLSPLDHFGFDNNGSWWLGEKGDFFVKNLLQMLIKRISTEYECQNNIYFYGSSMGGYGAILHGILCNARAVYANVPQIRFVPTIYFKSFHKNVQAIFGNKPLTYQENDLLDWLDSKNKFPLFYLCENIIEEKEHLKNYFKEHTLAFMHKCYEFQIKSHFEILPQEGHTKNYGLKEVIKKFEQFLPPIRGKNCMDTINMLEDNIIWYSNLGNMYKPLNKELILRSLESQRIVYLILGNKAIKQVKPSKNLIDISALKRLSIKINLSIPSYIEGSLFIQTFNAKSLQESTKYQLRSGENNITLNELHPSIEFMKLLFSFASNSKEKYDVIITKLEICVDEYLKINSSKKTIQKNNLIPNIPHTIFSQNILLKDGEYTYEVVENNTMFNFYLNYIKSSKLIIALPGATDRNKPFYNFQRYSWSQNITCSFMSLLDPTIQKDNDLTIGWFQGKQGSYALEKLVSFLKKLFKENNIEEKNVIFFGSSAGGYTSLKLVEKFPLSVAIVINPQIYLYNYSEKVYKKLLVEVYKGESKTEVYKKYKNRLEIQLNLEDRKAPIYYFQNIQDYHHLTKHLKPFLRGLTKYTDEKNINLEEDLLFLKKTEKKLNVFYYNDPESGHSPPNKEKTLNILHSICKE